MEEDGGEEKAGGCGEIHCFFFVVLEKDIALSCIYYLLQCNDALKFFACTWQINCHWNERV